MAVTAYIAVASSAAVAVEAVRGGKGGGNTIYTTVQLRLQSDEGVLFGFLGFLKVLVQPRRVRYHCVATNVAAGVRALNGQGQSLFVEALPASPRGLRDPPLASPLRIGHRWHPHPHAPNGPGLPLSLAALVFL